MSFYKWYPWLKKFTDIFRWNNSGIADFQIPDLLDIIVAAKRDWEHAKRYFDCVTDQDLIDHAIFNIDATEKKYIYLLKKAREIGLNIEGYNLS